MTGRFLQNSAEFMNVSVRRFQGRAGYIWEIMGMVWRGCSSGTGMKMKNIQADIVPYITFEYMKMYARKVGIYFKPVQMEIQHKKHFQ